MQGCTDSCEEGPFFTTDAPEVPSGSDIAAPNTIGERMYFEATIKNTKGEGIVGAKADVVSIVFCDKMHVEFSHLLDKWQADGDGLYDVQYPNRNEGVPDDRATIVAESNGYFCYRGRLPVAYPIVSCLVSFKFHFSLLTYLKSLVTDLLVTFFEYWVCYSVTFYKASNADLIQVDTLIVLRTFIL